MLLCHFYFKWYIPRYQLWWIAERTLHIISLYEYTNIYLPSLLLIEISVVSNFFSFRKKNTCLTALEYKNFTNCLVKNITVETALLDNVKLFFKVDGPINISYNKE